MYSHKPIITLLSSFCLCLSAADYHIGPHGNDSHSGSANQPWKTCEPAKNTLVPGDRLLFLPGTYQVTQPMWLESLFGTAEQPIWIGPKNGTGTVTFDGINLPFPPQSFPDLSRAVFRLDKSEHVIIEGLRVINSHFYGFLAINSDDITIQNCLTDLTWSSGIRMGGMRKFWDPNQGKLLQRRVRNLKILNNTVLRANHLDAPGSDPQSDRGPHEGITVARATHFEIAYNEVAYGEMEGIDSKGPNAHGHIHHNYIHHQGRIPEDQIDVPIDQRRYTSLGIYIDPLFFDVRYIDQEAELANRAPQTFVGIEDIVIENNTIHHVGQGITIGGDGQQDITSVIARRNLIYRANWAGFNIGDVLNKAGTTSHVLIEHNTVWLHSEKEGQSVLISNQDINNITIKNNIFSFMPPTTNIRPRGHVVADVSIVPSVVDLVIWNNLYHGEFKTVSGSQHWTGFDATFGDPLFANPSAGNFSLQTGSPAIDVGPHNDADGSLADLGAFPVAGTDVTEPAQPTNLTATLRR